MKFKLKLTKVVYRYKCLTCNATVPGDYQQCNDCKSM